MRIPTRALLTCGATAGPVFLAVVLVQDYTRPGFDPRRHPLSLLGRGEGGWVQVSNFVLTGLLDIAFAVGLRRAWRGGPGGTWAPPLIAVYGSGLVAVGVFRADPAWGYPPGTPDERTDPESTPAVVHGLGFMVLFTALVAACFVFAKAFAARGDRPWSVAAGGVGVALPVLLARAVRAPADDQQSLSLGLRAITLVGWGFAALVARRVRARLGVDGATAI